MSGRFPGRGSGRGGRRGGDWLRAELGLLGPGQQMQQRQQNQRRRNSSGSESEDDGETDMQFNPDGSMSWTRTGDGFKMSGWKSGSTGPGGGGTSFFSESSSFGDGEFPGMGGFPRMSDFPGMRDLPGMRDFPGLGGPRIVNSFDSMGNLQPPSGERRGSDGHDGGCQLGCCPPRGGGSQRPRNSRRQEGPPPPPAWLLSDDGKPGMGSRPSASRGGSQGQRPEGRPRGGRSNNPYDRE